MVVAGSTEAPAEGRGTRGTCSGSAGMCRGGVRRSRRRPLLPPPRLMGCEGHERDELSLRVGGGPPALARAAWGGGSSAWGWRIPCCWHDAAATASRSGPPLLLALERLLKSVLPLLAVVPARLTRGR